MMVGKKMKHPKYRGEYEERVSIIRYKLSRMVEKYCNDNFEIV